MTGWLCAEPSSLFVLDIFDYLALSGLHTLVAFVSLPFAVIFMPLLSPHSHYLPKFTINPGLNGNVLLWPTTSYAVSFISDTGNVSCPPLSLPSILSSILPSPSFFSFLFLAFKCETNLSRWIDAGVA